jgi:hypothetical protein
LAVTRRVILGGALAAGALAAGPALAAPSGEVERWGVFEVALTGPPLSGQPGDNPFDDVRLTGIFECGGRQVRVAGFYDGDATYRIRFSPDVLGPWRWRSESNVAPLDGRSGTFRCGLPRKGNHGPVQVSQDGFHFVHADGTPYRQIGTTSYSWALQSDAKCAQTLETLRGAPFNKMRMLVFPNVASVAVDPFRRTGPGLRDWDPARFDPAYFRRYEDRLRRLGALGIQADVVLYHPYDARRGYSDMARADDERYVRYVAARFGAFRHVWWSMANEYDDVKSKSMADWDHLFQVLQAADPHDRLRSIHQIRTYYDHRKPWITHASVQNGHAVLDDGRAELHRAMTGKPVIFDEVCYEGNIAKRWGNLSAETMVERFWWGTIGGTYVGHSETFSSDRDADHSWLGQGGNLEGQSASRLAFLRRILEEGPAPGIDPIQTWWGYRLAGKEQAYYLRYFGRDAPANWAVVLPGKGADARQRYRADIIDSWNMTITPAGTFTMAQMNDYDVHDPGRPTLALPGTPWMAVRLVRV